MIGHILLGLLGIVGCIAALMMLAGLLFITWCIFKALKGSVLTKENAAKMTRNVLRRMIKDGVITTNFDDITLEKVNEYIAIEFKNIIDVTKGVDK